MAAACTTALTPQHAEQQAAYRRFADRHIAPSADRFDSQEALPDDLVDKLRSHGYFGLSLPAAFGGDSRDQLTLGLFHEEIGRACSSVRSVLTVHAMVAQALVRWGTAAQKDAWLPRLARGATIAAFALTEPDAGSDIQAIQASADASDHGYVLNGHKKWITGGRLADLFLVFARADGQAGAFLVERATAGVTLAPINGMLGLRAAMLADLHLRDVWVPDTQRLGPLGFGLSHVASTALDLGRFTVAWGAVGIAQACLDASLRYARTRTQFGVPLIEHQLVQRMITDMVANVSAGRLLCREAAAERQAGDPHSIVATLVAKYFASRTAWAAATDCVQIHGATGCSPEHPAHRYLRDAKIMEIIEGSSQIQQIAIAQQARLT